MDSSDQELKRKLGKDLRRHFCSVVALAYRYQNDVWACCPLLRKARTQALRDLNRAVALLSRLIIDCGVSLPRTSSEIERYSYIEVDSEIGFGGEPQIRAEVLLQRALSHTSKMAYRSEHSDIAEALSTLRFDSLQRLERLYTTRDKSMVQHTPAAAVLAFA